MAIIKAIKYKGFNPYWWDILDTRVDYINNATYVTLCVYASSNSCLQNKKSYIDGIFFSDSIPGVDLTREQTMNLIISQNSNSFFTGAVNTDGSYSLENVQSIIYEQISNERNTGFVRFAECIDFRYFMRNNIIILNLIIHYAPDGINVDSNLDVEITWVVDDYYKIPNTTIGEASYFIGMVMQGTSIFDVIRAGIHYGDSDGSIDSKLY